MSDLAGGSGGLGGNGAGSGGELTLDGADVGASSFFVSLKSNIP